ncbi:MAG: hypothetical protein MJ187_03655 [Alphaproteobacteria bacterium]|nr:hypothetical protein [Alphaproteobacteria bacterium]
MLLIYGDAKLTDKKASHRIPVFKRRATNAISDCATSLIRVASKLDNSSGVFVTRKTFVDAIDKNCCSNCAVEGIFDLILFFTMLDII